ncbi:MAG: hypothetical protein LBI63_03720 [Candidatus Ancillula sp.]|jgi:hypothetical protein|nr:hypothetical protein [Candidatus Ancillula sp.]
MTTVNERLFIMFRQGRVGKIVKPSADNSLVHVADNVINGTVFKNAFQLTTSGHGANYDFEGTEVY